MVAFATIFCKLISKEELLWTTFHENHAKKLIWRASIVS